MHNCGPSAITSSCASSPAGSPSVSSPATIKPTASLSRSLWSSLWHGARGLCVWYCTEREREGALLGVTSPLPWRHIDVAHTSRPMWRQSPHKMHYLTFSPQTQEHINKPALQLHTLQSTHQHWHTQLTGSGRRHTPFTGEFFILIFFFLNILLCTLEKVSGRTRNFFVSRRCIPLSLFFF